MSYNRLSIITMLLGENIKEKKMTRKQAIEQSYINHGYSASNKIANILINKIFDDFESREKKMTREEELLHRLDNAKKRYEIKCQELDECSKFSTQQAIKILDLESQPTCENCKYVYICDIDGHICNNEKSKLFCSKVDSTVYCSEFVSTDT